MIQPARGIWWLHPAALFGIAGTAIALCAFFIPEETYHIYWRTPKFFDPQGLWLTLACCAVFGFGAVLSSRFLARRAQTEMRPDPVEAIPWGVMSFLFRATFYLAVLGYVLWIGLAISAAPSTMQ